MKIRYFVFLHHDEIEIKHQTFLIFEIHSLKPIFNLFDLNIFRFEHMNWKVDGDIHNIGVAKAFKKVMFVDI